MYSFDPVGSYEREPYRAGGSSSSMLQPLLDNQVNTAMDPILQNLTVNNKMLINFEYLSQANSTAQTRWFQTRWFLYCCQGKPLAIKGKLKSFFQKWVIRIQNNLTEMATSLLTK